jgi:hypothetical protein
MEPPDDRSHPETGQGDSQADFALTISDNPDLDYWIRVAEGPSRFSPCATHGHLRMDDGSISCNCEISGMLEDFPEVETMWASNILDRHSDSLLESSREIRDQSTSSGLAFSHANSASRVWTAEVKKSTHIDEITKQISDRFGRFQIAEDGQVRYYGATSNLHILHNGPSALTQPSLRRIEDCGDVAIAQAGLAWPSDDQYLKHVVDLFFCWHNPLVNVVDPVTFFRAERIHASGQKTPFYSLCLANAM